MSFGFLPISGGAIADIPMGRSALIVTGVVATSALGTVTTTTRQRVTLVGFDMAAQLGTGFTTNGDLGHVVTGVAASGAVGTTTQTGAASHALTGVEATSGLGSAVFANPSQATLAGVAATLSLGDTTQSAAATAPLEFSGVGGLQATGTLGAFVTSGGVIVELDGVQAAGEVGEPPVVSNYADVVLDGFLMTSGLGAVESVDMSPWKPIVPTGASAWAEITTTV